MVDECSCCDEFLTQEDLNMQIIEDIEDLQPKKKK